MRAWLVGDDWYVPLSLGTAGPEYSRLPGEDISRPVGFLHEYEEQPVIEVVQR